MPGLQINKEGVLKFLSKRVYGTDADCVCEIYGSWPGKIKNMSITLTDNILIIAGDDGGLTPEDIKRLQELFSSWDNGHS